MITKTETRVERSKLRVGVVAKTLRNLINNKRRYR
jgi:hypothetical protein